MLEWLSGLHGGAILQIVGLDLLLGVDNAILIGLACKGLPAELRRAGILWGTAGALVLRFIFVGVASWLLYIPLLSVVGGLLLFAIAIRLGVKKNEAEVHTVAPSKSLPQDASPKKQLWSAIRLIMVADALMSLDNALGLAGAAHSAPEDQRFFLIAFGLLLSLPIILFASQGVLQALQRFPWLVNVGAALLGWIAMGLILNDPVIQRFGALTFSIGAPLLQGAAALLILVAVVLFKKRAA